MEEQETMHILGVVGKTIYNMTTKKTECAIQMVVSDEILSWLEAHDKKINKDGETIYVCNAVRYVYLGVQPPMILLTGEKGEA